VSADGFLLTHLDQIVGLAARHSVPTAYAFRQAITLGGLMSYGTDFPHAWRQAGVYTGRILQGEKPADLPVQQVTKMELIINLRTAKTLGLNVPNALIGRADKVIE
jgi:putative ABC transport system substrate-binding protein